MGFTKEKQVSCSISDQKCQCKNENLCAPKKSKMKVFKKIKKSIGFGSSKSATCPGQNNLPPLRFHHIHGSNIRISHDGMFVKRFNMFNNGVTFSDRPVNPNERVTVKFSDISTNWTGTIRFGFTVIDPETFYDPSTARNSLPKHACPDLTNRHGFWAKALNERYCETDNILSYYFTASGDVHFSINGNEKGVFLKIPPTRDPLWVLIDVYGNCAAIEFLDQRLCSRQRRPDSRLSLPILSTATSQDEVDSIVPNLHSLSFNENCPLPRSRSVTSLRQALTPILFHRTRGQSVHLSEDKFIATRIDSDYTQGYMFTAQPIRIGERIVIQVLRTEPMGDGGLTLGLTSCDPATLQPCDLPNDAEQLLDRPEYWVVNKNAASNLARGDQIVFSITTNGEVYISKNNGAASLIMQVDRSLQLWAFFDIYGSIQSIRILSQMIQSTLQQASVSTMAIPTQRPVLRQYASQYLPSTQPISNIGVILPSRVSQSRQSLSVPTTSAMVNRAISNNEMIQLQSGTATVLVVNIPASNSNSDLSVTSQTHQIHQSYQPQSTQLIQSAAISPARSSHSGSFAETTPTKHTSPSKQHVSPQKHRSPQKYGPLSQWQDLNGASLGQTECAICCENQIDSALYACGHMCMCYECALKQWHGVGGGHCPLCRAVIRDVIRIYKS